MSSSVASDLIAGLLPLVGAALGASATIAVQRSSTKASQLQFRAEAQAIRCAEVKSAVLNYFEQTQRLQGQLDARERGESPPDLKMLIEKVWLAEKQVEIIASDTLRDRLIDHARGLHQVVRDPESFPDWWQHCSDLQSDLLTRIKVDLTPSEVL